MSRLNQGAQDLNQGEPLKDTYHLEIDAETGR